MDYYFKFIYVFELLHEDMWKVSSRDWKKWRPSSNVCVVQSGLAVLRFSSHAQLCPDADFTQELGAPIDRQTFVRDSLSRSLQQNKPGTASYRPSSQLQGSCLTSFDDTMTGDPELDPSDDEYPNTTSKLQTLQQTFDDLSVSYRFFGKSSGATLVQTALDLKSEYSGTEQENMRLRMANRRPEFWAQYSVRAALRSPFALLTYMKVGTHCHPC